eukprot:COSAG02_NODE_8531_length_2534_cov_20.902259_2_plen_297_part_00
MRSCPRGQQGGERLPEPMAQRRAGASAAASATLGEQADSSRTDQQLGGTAVVTTITTLEKYPYADGVGDNGQRLSSLADAVLKFVWIFTVRGKCQCVRTNGRGCACVVNVGQGTDVEYVPVCGDPQLVVQSLVSCIEAHRDLADPISEEEEEEEDELGEMGQVALVALAKRTGVAGEQIDRARCAADGAHPFSLWAMFRRFTTHEVTESGFWRITTNNAKVLGRSVKPNSNIAHYYLDETGKMQLEVPGRHRVMCRILRVNEPRDRRIFQARLAVVHTEVRVASTFTACRCRSKSV